jgi:HEPN domain-containing protein
MQPESQGQAREWLLRADRDILIAQRALEGSIPLGEATAYHAQQAAEKALKGFLVAHDLAFPFTHALVPLVRMCYEVTPAFAQFLAAAQLLTPYAVRFRYPEGPLEPPIEEAREALRLAGDIVRFVRPAVFGKWESERSLEGSS